MESLVLKEENIADFQIRLPVEYYRANSSISQTGQTLDASEGGLQILFSEQMDIGQNLKLKLFFSSCPELNAIEMLVRWFGWTLNWEKVKNIIGLE